MMCWITDTCSQLTKQELTLLFPINFRKNHWILLVVAIKSARVFVLDPYLPHELCDHLVAKAEELVTWMKSTLKQVVKSFQDSSDYKANCGIYVCVLMLTLAAKNFKSDLPNIRKFRALISNWIINKNIVLEALKIWFECQKQYVRIVCSNIFWWL